MSTKSESLACRCAGYERRSNAVEEENETAFVLQPNISRNGETLVEE